MFMASFIFLWFIMVYFLYYSVQHTAQYGTSYVLTEVANCTPFVRPITANEALHPHHPTYFLE